MIWFWSILGLVLIAAELALPGLVAGSVGLAALIAAGLAWLGVPAVGQLVVWGTLSAVFTSLTRRLVPKASTQMEEPREARSIAPIPAGELGRVSYQGSIWNAKCSIPELEIPAEQALYVVERQGNTLLVMPAKMLQEG